MNQEYLILDNGGVMTPVNYERHLNTIDHYNRLVDRLAHFRQGTEVYNSIQNKLKRLQAFIEEDQKKARHTADRLLNKEN